MPIQFNCPHCSKAFKVNENLAGKSVKCNSCGETMKVPDGSAALPPVKKQLEPPVKAPAPPRATSPAVQVETGVGPTIGSPGGSNPMATRNAQRKAEKKKAALIAALIVVGLIFGTILTITFSGGQKPVAGGGNSNSGRNGSQVNRPPNPSPRNPRPTPPRRPSGRTTNKPTASGLGNIIPGNLPSPATNNGGITNPGQPGEESIEITGPSPDGSLMTIKNPEFWSISASAISPNGRYALTGIESVRRPQPMRYWDLKEGRCIRTLEGHIEDIITIEFSPDGSHVLSSSKNKEVKYWNLQTGECIHTFELDDANVEHLSFTRDGNRVVASCFGTRMYFWDLQNGEKIRELKWNHPIRFVRVMPDNRFAIFGDGYKGIAKWNLETDETTELFETDVQFDLSVVTPDCRFALVKKLYVNDEFLYLIDLQTGKSTKTCEENKKYIQSIKCLAISPDGRYAACGTNGYFLSTQPIKKTPPEVRCWDLKTGEVFHQYTGHEFNVPTVSITPDGRHVLSSGKSDKTLKYWKLR